MSSSSLKIVGTPARRPSSLPSPAAQQAQINMALVSTSWQSLELESQETFNFLGQSWSPNPNRATSSGFSVYKSLNLARLAMGEDLLTRCPIVPEVVQTLPSFTVEATLTAANVFALKIQTNTFNGAVLVSASRPKSSGTTKFRADQGRIITCAPTLTGDVMVFTNEFLSVFPRPTAGTRLCVILTPISANGFRGVTRSMMGIVTRLTSPEFSVK